MTGSGLRRTTSDRAAMVAALAWWATRSAWRGSAARSTFEAPRKAEHGSSSKRRENRVREPRRAERPPDHLLGCGSARAGARDRRGSPPLRGRILGAVAQGYLVPDRPARARRR